MQMSGHVGSNFKTRAINAQVKFSWFRKPKILARLFQTAQTAYSCLTLPF